MACLIEKAGAWCNGEVAYLAWQVARKIDGCLGFLVTRIHETGPDAGQRRVLPTWIAFTDQSNPDWLAQDASVWPIGVPAAAGAHGRPRSRSSIMAAPYPANTLASQVGRSPIAGSAISAAG